MLLFPAPGPLSFLDFSFWVTRFEAQPMKRIDSLHRQPLLSSVASVGEFQFRLQLSMIQIANTSGNSSPLPQKILIAAVHDQKGVPHHLLGTISHMVDFIANDFRDSTVSIDFDILKHWAEPLVYNSQDDWSANLNTILE